MQVSSFFFHQGKQQHTLVLGQASNQVVTFLKVRGQGQIGIPPNHKNAYFIYLFISKSIVCACLKLNL